MSATASSSMPANTTALNDDTAFRIILFYKYVNIVDPAAVVAWHETRCVAMSGRVLISREGINGNLSGARDDLVAYERDLVTQFPALFTDIEFKSSSVKASELPAGIDDPFPDLRIKLVDEVISTGGRIPAALVATDGGTHLSPREFHDMLLGAGDETVLLDTRNNKEVILGHFARADTADGVAGTAAINPRIRFFSEYTKYVDDNVETFKKKRVMMYCTGGIRCEKASAYLVEKGIATGGVYQLRGGIHKYLEEFPDGGLYRGKNFVFDRRGAMEAPGVAAAAAAAAAAAVAVATDADTNTNNTGGHGDCSSSLALENANARKRRAAGVGSCANCAAAYDTLRGDRVCTVCRDSVLICDACVIPLKGQFHCDAHALLRECFFHFIDAFARDELVAHAGALDALLSAALKEGKRARNRRATLRKQIERVRARIAAIDSGDVVVTTEAPVPCRSCARVACDGQCWGFYGGAQAATAVSQ